MMDNFLSEKKVMPMLIVMADGMMSEDGDPEKKINPSLFTKFLTQDLMPYVEARYRVLTGRETARSPGFRWDRCRRPWQRFPIRKNLPGSGFFRLSAQLYRGGGNCGQPFDAGVCGRRGIQSEYETSVPCDGA